MRELLFELGTEEIPARLLRGSRHELCRRLEEGLEAAGLAFDGIHGYATPRRLAVVATVAERQPDRTAEMLGPPVEAAFDADGVATAAAQGFARRHGVSVDALERRPTERGERIGLTVHTPGRPATELLPAILATCIDKLTWPKAMRWGSRRESFIRPVHWIVALYDGEVLPLAWGGVTADRWTRGHRFMAPAPFEVHTALSWLEGLRERYVEPDAAIREERVEAGAHRLAADVGGSPALDDALLEEVGGIVEWPVPLLGNFEASYLELPPAVITTPMTVHQRYIPIIDSAGALTRHFVIVAGIEATDPSVISAGNGRVLRARLADARFFFEQDTRVPLDSFVPKLEERVFLQGLGTMGARAVRLQELSGLLCATLAPDAPEAPALAARAGLLAKADLATGVVGEFAQLQGEMGREYARRSGEPDAVAEAIFEHYMPRSATDDIPESLLGRAVALADKLDALVGCFSLGLEPTGSADPYALRRQALGVIRILEEADPAPGIAEVLDIARSVYGGALAADWPPVRERLLEFFRGRMKAALAQDYTSDLAEAVLAVGFDDPADARGRLEALFAMKRTEGWDAMAATVKRVRKIVEDTAPGELDPASLTEPAERGLFEAWTGVERAASRALDAGEYADALEGLATLEPAIERFFVEVLVMSEDPSERARRLALLARVDGLFHRIAAFDRVST
ncbi:MAG: glycine--tRNA ligase subunit beta [Deltaproteobacteria bacterium]|nr:glycine--tRNA ligase subunit beta [Deltaproteobacteria bacterium]MCB9787306.1 glycine--tRNA ligase subunit beta [Deltaproteobacteria bacterium]